MNDKFLNINHVIEMKGGGMVVEYYNETTTKRLKVNHQIFQCYVANMVINLLEKSKVAPYILEIFMHSKYNISKMVYVY
jgi:hypothetical protein